MGLINCIILEDNLADRTILEAYISVHNGLRLAGSFTHPLECADFLKTNEVSLIFSDIDMPGMNGLEFFRSLSITPLCIFITAHPEYAPDAFDVNAVDYVLKPVKPERLYKAVQRAAELLEIKARALEYQLKMERDYLLIKEGTVNNRVNVSDIIYLEALTNYTKVVTSGKKYITLQNLKGFLEFLPPEKFLRIHRSYAVAVNRIMRIDTHELLVGEQRLPLGKTYKQAIRKIVTTGR